MKQRLIFLGPPGAGKGTQSEIIAKENNLLHLSTGDLLRAEVKAGSVLGKEVEKIMNSGELVSDQLVLSIVEARLQSTDKGWLLDGFPRNVSQARSLETLLEKLQKPLEVVISIEVDDDYLIQRLLARGREDDNEDVIRNRLDVYKEKTEPLIDHYKSMGLLRSVSGNGEVRAIADRIKVVLS